MDEEYYPGEDPNDLPDETGLTNLEKEIFSYVYTHSPERLERIQQDKRLAFMQWLMNNKDMFNEFGVPDDTDIKMPRDTQSETRKHKKRALKKYGLYYQEGI